MRFSARSPSRETNDANAYVTGHSNSGAGSDIPIGWPYNPSTWFGRLWLVAAALVGFAVSGYLALYQLGYFSEVWEPLFRHRQCRGSALRSVATATDPRCRARAAAYLVDGVLGGGWSL